MEDIKDLLKRGETEKALDRLIGSCRHTAFENDGIQLSARHFSNLRDRARGLLDEATFERNQNRVVHDALALADQLARKPAPPSAGSAGRPEGRTVAFCEANPLDRNLLSNVEARELQALLRREPRRLALRFHFALTLDGLLDAIRSGKPDVIHFSAFANAEGIYFHDRQDQPVQIGNDLLALHLQALPVKPGCLFFNTFIDPALGRSLARDGVCVIGFDRVIDSNAAIRFATGFYTALSYDKDYEAAFRIGRDTLAGGGYGDVARHVFAFQGERSLA